MKDLMKQICKEQAHKDKDNKLRGARYKSKVQVGTD